MEYRTTSATVYACQYHVVFCPKYRRKLLRGMVAERFKQIAAAAIADIEGAEVLEMEVMPDHVHMLLEVPPQVAVGKAIARIKGRTSHDLREEFPWLRTKVPTLWTRSYFCSTVGGAPLEKVQEYIQNQKTSQRQKEKMG